MKYLVFGGTGFIGSNFIEYIKEKGDEVLSISRSGENGSLAIDITDEVQFSKIDYRPDVVINCASILPEKSKTSKDSQFLKDLFLTNVMGAANIANWAVKKEVPKLINTSTLVVVKKPWPIPLLESSTQLPEGQHVGYAMSKLSQEQIMNYCTLNSKTNLIHLRLSAVYGAGMKPEGIIFDLLEKFVNEKEIRLTDAEKNSVDFIHVNDVCQVLYKVGITGSEENVINVASGKDVTILKLAHILKDLSRSKSEIKDTQTGRSSSKAVINVNRMKGCIGSLYDEFKSLESGLGEITERYKK